MVGITLANAWFIGQIKNVWLTSNQPLTITLGRITSSSRHLSGLGQKYFQHKKQKKIVCSRGSSTTLCSLRGNRQLSYKWKYSLDVITRVEKKRKYKSTSPLPSFHPKNVKSDNFPPTPPLKIKKNRTKFKFVC